MTSGTHRATGSIRQDNQPPVAVAAGPDLAAVDAELERIAIEQRELDAARKQLEAEERALDAELQALSREEHRLNHEGCGNPTCPRTREHLRQRAESRRSSAIAFMLLFDAVWITGLVLWTRGGTETLRKVGKIAFGVGFGVGAFHCAAMTQRYRRVQQHREPGT
jgi:hypothetical protein